MLENVFVGVCGSVEHVIQSVPFAIHIKWDANIGSSRV